MSAAYEVLVQAMVAERPVACVYQGLARVMLPIILGWSGGREKVLAYQTGGRSSRPLRGPERRWRCLWVDEIAEARLGDGPWDWGGQHRSAQSCVTEVDLDVNPLSPYAPRRSVAALRGA